MESIGEAARRVLENLVRAAKARKGSGQPGLTGLRFSFESSNDAGRPDQDEIAGTDREAEMATLLVSGEFDERARIRASNDNRPALDRLRP